MAKRGVLPTYKSYMFRDKDPVIDQLRTLAKDTIGDVDYGSLAEVHVKGGPTVSCMAGWFHGGTKRPQSATVEAAGRAMGFHRVWQKLKGK